MTELEFSDPSWFGPVQIAVAISSATSTATAFVILARRKRHRRMPRPAEWLALLTMTAMIAASLPSIDIAVLETSAALPSLESLWDLYASHQWACAMGGLMLSSGLIATASRLPAGRWALVRTLLVMLGSLSMLWVPNHLIPRYLFDFVSDRSLWEYIAASRVVGSLPLGLLLGVPTVSALRSLARGQGRGWRWTGAVGGVSAVAAGIGQLNDGRTRSRPVVPYGSGVVVPRGIVLSVLPARPPLRTRHLARRRHARRFARRERGMTR